MCSSRILKGLIVFLLLFTGGEGFAAQLDGLQVQSGQNKLQIILDIDQTQDYKLEYSEKSGTSISLPKAKLPDAFQGTGLPPVKNPKTDITAEVHETDDGIQIKLSGPKANQIPVEIRFKGDLEASPSLITPSAVAPEKNNYKTSVSTRKKYVNKHVLQTTRRYRKISQPVAVFPKKVVPSEKIVFKQPPLLEDNKKLQPKSNQGLVIPVEKEKIAQITEKEAVDEGYNFLNQPAEKESLVTVEPEEPSVSKTYTVPFIKTKKPDQISALTKKDKKSLLAVVLKWVGISLVIMGTLLLAGIFLAFRVKKHLKKPSEESESSDYLENSSTRKHFEPESFRQYMGHPLQTSCEYLEKDQEKPVFKNKLEEIPEYFEPIAENRIKNDFPIPEYYEDQPVRPAKNKVDVETLNDKLLFDSPHSLSDTVKNTIGGKKLNPYLTPPLKMEKRSAYTAGGPRSLKKPRRYENAI